MEYKVVILVSWVVIIVLVAALLSLRYHKSPHAEPPSRVSDQLLHSTGLLQKRAEAAELLAAGLKDTLNRQAEAMQAMLRRLGESESREKEIEFYREQIVHLQAAVVNQAETANARVGALVDVKAESLVGAQHLRRPPAGEDGFRDSPPDSSPADTIRIPEAGPRTGEARINRPEPASLRGSQYEEPFTPHLS